jgi:hypothetical protein
MRNCGYNPQTPHITQATTTTKLGKPGGLGSPGPLACLVNLDKLGALYRPKRMPYLGEAARILNLGCLGGLGKLGKPGIAGRIGKTCSLVTAGRIGKTGKLGKPVSLGVLGKLHWPPIIWATWAS